MSDPNTPPSLEPSPTPPPPIAHSPLAYASGTYGPPNKTGRNIVVLIACCIVALVLVVGFYVAIGAFPSRSREQSHRVKCGNNLRSIGESLTLYANENNSLPRTLYDSTSPVSLSFDSTGASSSDPFAPNNPVSVNNVSAALFLLIRSHDLTPKIFTCPSSADEQDKFAGGDPNQRSNFSSSPNLSYALANPYPDSAATQAGYRWTAGRRAEFALAGDRAAAGVVQTSITSNQPQHRTGNSPNHDHDGQSVLFGDFHVEWTNTATVGVGRDNIYFPNGPSPTLGPVPGVPRSTAEDDSFLLPRN